MSERRDAAARVRTIAFRSARMPSRMRRSAGVAQWAADDPEIRHFKQLEHSGSEAISVDCPDFEAINVEQAPVGGLDL